MAATSGHGNPTWTREEIILALELYHMCKGKIPGPTDDRVRKLSATLRDFPHHIEAARKTSFRNADGVAFKLQNLRSIDTGQGLKNTSKADREVWEELGNDPKRTHELANIIRESIQIIGSIPEAAEELEFFEGKSATKLHSHRERSKKLRAEVISTRLKLGNLCCDLCAEDGKSVKPTIRDSMFECHHIIPLSSSGETKTKAKDMALLRANCHRLLHREIVNKKQWLSIEEARKLIFI